MSKAYSQDLRERVIKSWLEGLPKQVIVVLFNIGMDTLNRWIRRYNETGNVTAKERTIYRQRKFSDGDLLNYIELHPSATLEEMAKHFLVKPSSIYARLELLGVTRKKNFLYEERDEKARDEFIEELKALSSYSIVYIDESGIKNNIKQDYARALRGQPIRDDKKGSATEKLNIIAGLLNNKMIAPLTYHCSTDSVVFNTWLEKCLIPVLPEKCVIVMDNATFHKSAKTKEIIENNGHQLLFLPAYSPDFNPIEQCWAFIKAKIKKYLSEFACLYSCLQAIFKTI